MFSQATHGLLQLVCSIANEIYGFGHYSLYAFCLMGVEILRSVIT